MGEHDQVINYAKINLSYKEIDPNSKIQTLKYIADAYMVKGEFDRALDYAERGLLLAEEKNNEKSIVDISYEIGQITWALGDFESATKNMEKVLEYYEREGVDLHAVLYSLIKIKVDEGSLTQAEEYLKRMDQLENPKNILARSQLYRVAKAFVLKSSDRAIKRGEAEKLLKEVAAEEIGHHGLTTGAIIELCHLLLSELSNTGDMELLEELNVYITRLVKISEEQHSFRWLAETTFLQSKLALIQADTDKARKLLSQAQHLANWHGHKRLAKKISDEHDHMLEQLEIWENFKNNNAPVSERIKMASLDGVMERIKRNTNVKDTQIETEQPVLLVILTKTGYLMLSNPFTADINFDDKLLVNFISSFNSFSDRLLAQSLDRAKFGEYTVLLKTVNSFSICYVFRGKSYSAGQKLNNFTEIIKESNKIMEILNKSVLIGQKIIIGENPDLERLIADTFLSHTQNYKVPFSAYLGEGPFLFVSYAHIDRLQVYPIIDYLHKSELKIWYDEGIPVSDNWRTTIVENIEHCTAFLVFISPSINDSEYVRKEINFALKRKKRFFAVYLRETNLPSELEFEMDEIQSMKKYLLEDVEFLSKLRDIIIPILK